MTIRYQCEQCNSVLKIKDELAGTGGKCPKCKKKFIVPNPSQDREPEPEKALEEPPHDDSTELLTGNDEEKLEPPKEKPPAKPASVPKPVKTSTSASSDDGDFDPFEFLMDDTSPGAKASAGLTAPPPPEAAAKPATDKQGRRHIVAPPPVPGPGAPANPMNAGSAAVNASANARDLLTKTMGDSRVRASAMPEVKRKGPQFDFKGAAAALPRLAGPLVGVVAAAFLLFWVANYFMSERLPLPPLARVTGTVTVGGQSIPNVLVHLSPVEVRGKSTKGKEIRLRNATGITDGNGYYEVEYMAGLKGAPVGKVRIWLEPVNPADYAKIPPQLLRAGSDLREVKAAGNDGNFNIDVPKP